MATSAAVCPERRDRSGEVIRICIQDVFELGMDGRNIAPFVRDAIDHLDLAAGTLGKSAHDRRPLILVGNDWFVAFLTATGASACQLMLERAQAASALP